MRFLRGSGVATAAACREHLGVSQPTFSRLVADAHGAVVAIGRARATRYITPREIATVGTSVPVYDVGPDGSVRPLARLHGVGGGGYYLDSEVGGLASAYYPDLPWFLFDLRPAGFLGRLIPRRHPDLALPEDIRLWDGDHCLRYLAHRGWDGAGSLVVGDSALRLFLEAIREPPALVAGGDRRAVYPRLAGDVLSHGAAGSSAAGEQPKFLVTRAEDRQPLLVKFSPHLDSPLARRVADLLLAEHLALRTLAAHGHPAARSSYEEFGDRAFLEVERFDRVPPHGRRGVVSLMALDAELGGAAFGWAGAVAELRGARVVPAAAVAEVRLLARFGALIANTDMHQGNLSFFVDGVRVVGACPAYDMTPMRYAPRSNQLPPEEPWQAPVPDPGGGDVEAAAQAAATDFWARVAADERGSAWLRATADANRRAVDGLAPLIAHLPGAR